MKLGDISALLGGRLSGNPDEEITGVSGLEDAGPGDITFIMKPALVPKAAASGASCVLVKEESPELGKSQIAVEDPQMAFARLLALFYPRPHPQAGISPLAHVAQSARIAADASISPFACIAAGAEIGRGSIIYPGAYVGEGSAIGEDCILYPNVTVREGVRIGSRVIIHSGSVIGADGFGYAFRGGVHVKIPQVGGVIIEDGVEIGACSTIDRATTGNTVIGAGTKIDNLVQIAHNVKIGSGSIIVSQAGIAGSSRLGNYVIVAGQAGIADHVEIEDGTVIGANSGVMPNSKLAKGAYAGSPVMPHMQWLRVNAISAKLPELNKTVQDMEKRLREIERRLQDDERQGD
ncbi:MAG: UDP-3-O-(3-hydroxymyristoyl)glucosamine N-acyltransferase [Nitrospiraceae bacterium]|nr:UDP-3-O-(3-hydroxymyristoyl)glucosamine N-acyltransferase [Nitrospiraceae bacterium]